MPIYLTKACASIGYFPEWIITGIVLTDTSALGRYYNQSEWAHAFGVSSLGVPVPVVAGDADRLYRWWYGPNASPASLAAPAIIPPIQQFFTGVQLAGPDLTPATFATGCSVPRRPVAAPPRRSTRTATRERPRSRATRRPPTTPSSGTTPRPRVPTRRTQRHRADALRQRRRPLQGGHRAVGAGPDVHGGGLGHQLRHPPDSPPSYPAWPGSPAGRRLSAPPPGRGPWYLLARPPCSLPSDWC